MILIVFVIVSFEKSSFSIDLLFLFDEILKKRSFKGSFDLLKGLLQDPYIELRLYSSIARFGDSDISHDTVTEIALKLDKLILRCVRTYSHQNKET